MSKPYKIEEQRMYTEVVYYDASGEERAREEKFDDHLWDKSAQMDVSEDEIEDYGLAD